MERHGQVTIFLALGMVLVFVVGFAFYLRSLPNNSILAVNENIPPPMLSYIKNTLEDAARGAVIETIAPQSGYQDPASAENQQPTLFYGKGLEMNFETEDVRYQALEEYPYPEYPYTMPPEAPPHPVVYYYLLGKFNIPSLERIQKELLAETEKRFNEHLDLSPFEGQGFEFIYPDQKPVINLSINFEDITVDLHYPLEVKTEDQRARLPNMTVNLPLRLNRTYELANCLVDRVVFDLEYGYSGPDDPVEEDIFEDCKEELELDDDFTLRTKDVNVGGDYKGRLVAINDTRNQENTGVAFEFQYLIWKCSGEFSYDEDEQKMRVCEYACAYEIPEVVLLGLCTRETSCDHFNPLPTVKKSDDGGIGIMQLTGTTCEPSIADGKALDKDDPDLEDNVECGAQELKSYYDSDVHGRYCCPFRFETAGKNVYHIYCVDPSHICNTDLNDVCCRYPGASEPFRYLAGEDYPPYKPCEWEHHKVAIPGTIPVEYDEWDSVTNIPPYCCEPGHPTYGQYCCEKVTTAPDWPSGQDVVDKNAYFIYAEESTPGTSFSGVIKDADYSWASWDGALRRYNGWGCESGFFQDNSVNCVIENYVDAAHKFGYDERETCRSSRSTPARVGGSEYVGQSDNPEGCCPIGDSVTPCKQSRTLKGWPSWP